MSSFFGLNVALTALRANQSAMDVTAHNIANANTEGYRRQEAIMTANTPYTSNVGGNATTVSQLGTGVIMSEVRRVQTDFMDAQVRFENSILGSWSAKDQTLQQVEPLLNEPGDSGLSAMMDRFWNAWSNLTTNPESISARQSVVATGSAMTEQVRNVYESIRKLQTDLDTQINDKTREINSIIQELADINNTTVRSSTGQFQPNDLIDKRDLLIEKLSNLVKIEVHGSAGANLIISVGGHVLVQGNWFSKINVETDINGWSQLKWSDDGSNVELTGGQITGLKNTRDDVLKGYLDTINNIVTTMRDNVNALHTTGYDGNGVQCNNFFLAGSTGANFSLDSEILANPIRVAASADAGTSGDNSIAREIAALSRKQLMGQRTIGETYTSLVTRIGADAKESAVHTDAHQFSLDQRLTQRDSVAGVSIDEEMSNMVRYQQAYNAAARIFTVLDDMLDTIIKAV